MGLGGQKRSDDQNQGVTMIELVVVMAIIAIIGLFMSPALGEWVAGFRVRGASKELADTLQLARLKAISTRNQYRVRLNINSGTGTETFVLQAGPGWSNEGSTITLPTGVNIDNIDAVNAGTVDRIFNADGMATGFGTTSTIFIENERNDQYRVIISRTGMIKMREGW